MTGDDEAKEEALVLEHDLPPNRNTRSTKPNEVQAYSIDGIVSPEKLARERSLCPLSLATVSYRSSAARVIDVCTK